jgi:hypothetical protein
MCSYPAVLDVATFAAVVSDDLDQQQQQQKQGQQQHQQQENDSKQAEHKQQNQQQQQQQQQGPGTQLKPASQPAKAKRQRAKPSADSSRSKMTAHDSLRHDTSKCQRPPPSPPQQQQQKDAGVLKKGLAVFAALEDWVPSSMATDSLLLNLADLD